MLRENLVFLLGVAALSYGLWLIWAPLTFLFVGLVLVLMAMALYQDRNRKAKT